MTQPIKFHPRHGAILYCDFDKGGFLPPEMVKHRPVVVVSRNHVSVATVVPLSGTPPLKPGPCYYKIAKGSLPKPIDANGEWWAKCDMVATVAFHRLEYVGHKRDPATGRRLYEQNVLGATDLEAIKACLRHHLCILPITS